MRPIHLSILIPFYEKIDFLTRCLVSIKAALERAKMIEDFEILLINDSPSILQESLQENLDRNFNGFFLKRIKIRTNPENYGVAISRNIGLDYATGEYIHIIDQDDEIALDFYLLSIQALKSADWVLTNGYFVNNNLKRKHLIYYLKPSLLIDNFILDDFVRSPGQVVFKQSLIGDCRFVKPIKYKGADDRFFWILMYALNPNMKLVYLSSPLYIAHLHKENFSHDSQELYRSCKELWGAMPKDLFSSKRQLVERNILAIDYVLNETKSLPAFIEYVRYKYRLNRMLRFFIKYSFSKW